VYTKEIELGTSNYFGLFSKGLYYDTTGSSNVDFQEGHYYVTRISAVTFKQGGNRNNQNDFKSFKSPWYAVITSTITNEDYLNGERRMYPILDGDPNTPPKMFYLDWSTEFTREDAGSTIPTISTL